MRNSTMKELLIYAVVFIAVFAIWQAFWRTSFFLIDLKAPAVLALILAAAICGFAIVRLRKGRPVK